MKMEQNGPPAKIELDKETVNRYLDLDKEIRSQEGRKTLNTLKAKKQQLEELGKTLMQLEENYKQLEIATAKEKADVDHMSEPSVKNFFKNQKDFEAQLSKEQQEYLEALSKQESAKKEVDNVRAQINTVQKEVDDTTKEADKLQTLYKQQEDLLAGIFGGRYGSEREYKLESELDMLLERKQRISAAKYRWQNARILMQHAVSQLAFSVRRWQELKRTEQNMQMKYHMVAEVRNHLIAAVQNIQSAQRYLHTINFPYCKADEVETLSKAINNIFTDMQSDDRHDHAQQCYSTMHRRSGALIQWFDQVINNIILKDLEMASNECRAKQRELRQERINLIKAKIKEVLNEDVEINDIGDDMFDDEDLEPELANLAAEADRVSLAGDTLGVGLSEDDAPTPLPLGELAPLPTMEDLFGNIENLKKQHEKDMQDFEKSQGQNKARMDQMLQEKLQDRKTRRQAMQKQQKEAAKLNKKK